MISIPIISTIFRPEAFYVSGLKIEKHGAREAITENVFSVESGAGTSGKAETVERIWVQTPIISTTGQARTQ